MLPFMFNFVVQNINVVYFNHFFHFNIFSFHKWIKKKKRQIKKNVKNTLKKGLPAFRW